MGRILLILLIALAVGLYVPRSRAWILEQAAPLADPAYGWMTRQELEQVVSDLELLLERRGREPFGPTDFDTWLDDRYPQDRSRVDAWGTRYRAAPTGNGLRVMSAGPDLEFDTSDDLVLDVADGEP